tara:strand:- start:1696 stop:3444 length:1749 start_codon:yes stop_codon:yes gene_type:complete
MNQLYGNDPTPARFNTQKYLQGGRVGMKRGGRGFGLKKVQKAGMEAAQAYFKNRPVEVPTPTFEGPPGKVKLTGVKFKNKAQEAEYIKLLKKRYEFPKGSKEAIKFLQNKDLAKKFNISIDSVERVNKILKNKFNLVYPVQTYEGKEQIQRERDKLRKEYQKKTSSYGQEQKIKRDIKKIDPTALAKEVDIAHRASLRANANLGAQYLVSSLGIDAKVVNQSLVKPIEQKLGTQYINMQKLIKGLTPGKVPKDIQKQIEKINLKISELADKTNGVLQGVLVDEKTLKPRVYGVDYSKVLGAGLVEGPVKELTQADRDLIKLNVGEQIKSTKARAPEDVKKFRNQLNKGAVNFAKKIEGTEIARKICSAKANGGVAGCVKFAQKNPARFMSRAFALGLAGELAFELAAAAPGYAAGKTGSELLGESIFGIFGAGTTFNEELAKYADSDAKEIIDLQEDIAQLEKTGSTIGALEAGLEGETELQKRMTPGYLKEAEGAVERLSVFKDPVKTAAYAKAMEKYLAAQKERSKSLPRQAVGQVVKTIKAPFIEGIKDVGQSPGLFKKGGKVDYDNYLPDVDKIDDDK